MLSLDLKREENEQEYAYTVQAGTAGRGCLHPFQSDAAPQISAETSNYSHQHGKVTELLYHVQEQRVQNYCQQIKLNRIKELLKQMKGNQFFSQQNK